MSNLNNVFLGAALVVSLVFLFLLVRGLFTKIKSEKLESLWLEVCNQISAKVSSNSSLFAKLSGEPECIGGYQGFGVSISAVLKEGAETYRIRLPLLSRLRISISPERVDLRRGVAKTSWPEVLSGDAQFDKAFVMASETPKLIPEILSSELRELLLGNRDLLTGRNFIFNISSIESTKVSSEHDMAKLAELMDLLVIFAKAVVSFEAEKLRTGDLAIRNPRQERSVPRF